MRKIILLADKTGDLGNRLFRLARFYNAKPQNALLFDITLYQFAYLYSPQPVLPKLGFLLLRLLDNRRFAALVAWLDKSSWVKTIDVSEIKDSTNDISNLYRIALEARERVVLVRGNTLYLRSGPTNQKALNRLRAIFRIKRKHKRRAAQSLGNLGLGRPIVGVHLRRRDYRTFRNGEFYFDNAAFNNIIGRLAAGWRESKPPCFLLVCEESLDIREFTSAKAAFLGAGSIEVDQALLEMCDYIIGPPSTFSSWPSLLHGIPRAEVHCSTAKVSYKDFKKTQCDYVAMFGL
jgi:hypothetical protein